MDLQRGITGFRLVDDQPLPISDAKAFRQHCFEVARHLGGQVRLVETFSKTDSRNFRLFVIELAEGAVAVLLNLHIPVVAFAEPFANGDTPKFIDAPIVADALRRFGVYEIPSFQELQQPVSDQFLSKLSPGEMEQVRYWRPRRICDVVFNAWD